MSYEYEIGGGLKSITDQCDSVTDPWNRVTTYTHDKVGRTTAIGAAGSETAYASGIKYRAFGAVKEMKLSTTAQTTVTMSYDEALRPANYIADNNAVPGNIQSASYAYGNDGLPKDITNNVNVSFNQKNEYDYAGRLKKNVVGTNVGTSYTFSQTMNYDAFNNLTHRENLMWGTYADDFTAAYANNRKAWGGTDDEYDAAGNVVYSYFNGPASLIPPGYQGRPNDDYKWWNYDAAGRMKRLEHYNTGDTKRKTAEETAYNGDGRSVLRTEFQKLKTGGVWSGWNLVQAEPSGRRRTR